MISASRSVNSHLQATQLKGGYALLLKISDQYTINTHNKQFVLQPGFYVYTGSALGQGGIEARIRRHLRVFNHLDVINIRDRKKDVIINKNVVASRYNWHIDLLLRAATDFTAIYAYSGYRIECQLIQFLKERGLRVIIGFGSTDCNSGCGGHLVYFPKVSIEKAKTVLMKAFRKLGLKPIVGSNIRTRA